MKKHLNLKQNARNYTWVLYSVIALFTLSCGEDDEIPLPVIEFSPFAATIEENPTLGAEIGKVAATSTLGEIVFAIEDESVDGALAIDASTGILTVADIAAFNFDSNQTITANISASVGLVSETIAATISILEEDEPPIAIVANDLNVSVDENLALDSIIAQVNARITQGSGVLTYSIKSQNPATAVSIDENGNLLVNNPVDFDYESVTVIIGTYVASAGETSAEGLFKIFINDLDERTVSATDLTASIDENSALNTVIGQASATVSEGPANLSFRLLQQSVQDAVSMNDQGELTINSEEAFDFETNPQITGTFEVAIIGGSSASSISSGTFTINLNDKFSLVRTLFAGTPGTFASTDGQGTDARFNEPVGMTFDNSGNLYVADKNNHKIRKIDANATVTTYAGTTAGFMDGFSAQFNGPVDVVFEPATDRIWVADQNNNTLRFITSTQNTFNFRSNGVTLGFRPNGLTMTEDNFYITQNHKIREVSVATGSPTTFVIGGDNAGSSDGTGTNAAFNNPRGIDVDSVGNLWVADYTSRKVRTIDPGTQETASKPGAYFEITDVAIAPDGNIYAVEKGNQRVRIVTESENAGDEIIATGFVGPGGIAIDPITGVIYISDTDAHCIYKLEKVQE